MRACTIGRERPSARKGDASIAVASIGVASNAAASNGGGATEGAATEDVACLWRQRRLERNVFNWKTDSLAAAPANTRVAIEKPFHAAARSEGRDGAGSPF